MKWTTSKRAPTPRMPTSEVGSLGLGLAVGLRLPHIQVHVAPSVAAHRPRGARIAPTLIRAAASPAPIAGPGRAARGAGAGAARDKSEVIGSVAGDVSGGAEIGGFRGGLGQGCVPLKGRQASTGTGPIHFVQSIGASLGRGNNRQQYGNA